MKNLLVITSLCLAFSLGLAPQVASRESACKGGRIEVSARPAGPGKAEIAIKDNGPGIDPADISHIFDRYYKGKQAKINIRGKSGAKVNLAAGVFFICCFRYTAHYKKI
ncbi:ATP-binding protein [Sporomusa termitida]|uniref:Histidine kinase/HSP90-like ATPase domain-containing protein n=1 Tax=Sporomusa termitida TaxID=2377 RepID=A0A517DW45_9FIRM|nr:sensor histidine kinase [Sporomusa termitida]QDR81571.1 hypothetical protein SPTER_29570 [Sporomusa termitida]